MPMQHRMEELQGALHKELSVRRESEQVYQEWLASKREARQWEMEEARRALHEVTQGQIPSH